MVDHAALTDPEIHEPKGASTATAGQVYTADGASSGEWAKPFKYVGVRSNYSTASPYVHAITTSDTVLDPTVATLNRSQFTVQTVPNLRLRYDGVEALVGRLIFNCSFRQSDGADRNIQWIAYKNGAPLSNSKIIATTRTTDWVNATLVYDVDMVTNDYIEMFAQSSSSFNTDYAKIYVSIEGHVV
jgi:hypothetical protein